MIPLATTFIWLDTSPQLKVGEVNVQKLLFLDYHIIIIFWK